METENLRSLILCGKGRPSACTMYVLCVGKGNRVLALMCVCGKGVLLLAPSNSTCIIGNGTGTHYNCVCEWERETKILQLLILREYF